MKYLCLMSSAAIAAVFMSDVLETVIIDGENGPMRINKSDFNPDVHKEHKAKKSDDFGTEGVTQNTVINAPPGMSVPPAPSTPPMLVNDQPDQNLQLMPGNPPVPSPAGSTVPQTQTVQNDQRLVSKIGKAWFVVNVAGEKIVADDIDSDKGYSSEADAWKAATPALAGNPAPTPANPA